MRKLWILWIVAALAASAWAGCRAVVKTGNYIDDACRPNHSPSIGWEDGSCKLCDSRCGSIGLACTISEYAVNVGCEIYCDGNDGAPRASGYCCTNECEADSAAAGGIILECQYDAIENKWYKYTCTGGNSCADGACRRDYYTDESLCLAKYCEDYPTAEGCEQEKDTTLFACSDLGNGKSGLYRLSCRALGGVVVSCNGKTDVNVETDGTLIREQDGTCAQNGFESGIFGGSSADSTQPEQQSAECFAVLGSKCTMRDRNSGNTYTCDCDGSCDYALRQLASGTGCANPYPQPQSSNDINLSSWNEGRSSAASAPSSAGSSATGGSSNSGGTSSGAEGGGNSSDFEYDYTDVLNDIRGNTQYTGTQVNYLNDKAAQANDYLRQLVNKDWEPVINVAAPDVNVEGGDTARAPAGILALLQDKMSGGEPNAADTAGTGAQEAAFMGRIDSVLNDTLRNMGDSIPGAVEGYRSAYNALKDSLAASAWADSVDKWTDALVDNGVITGSGSDNCPAVLLRKWQVPFGSVKTEVGPLGKYLCAVIPGVGVTMWALARVLLRAVVSILCMIWLFKAVMGIDGGSDEED